MKGQQIFYSFLPSVTAAVLTTQPTWAETAKASGVQQVVPPSVSTSTIASGSWLTKANNLDLDRQLFAASDRTLSATSSKNIGVVVIGKTGIPAERISGHEKAAIFSLSATLPAKYLSGDNIAVTSNQKQPSSKLATDGKFASVPKRPTRTSVSIPVPKVEPNARPISKTAIKNPGQRLRAAIAKVRTQRKAVSNDTLKLNSSQAKTLPKSTFLEPKSQKESGIQLSAFLQNNAKGSGTAKLLEVESCQQQAFIVNSGCSQKPFIRELVSQVPPPTPTTPAPVTPTVPKTPTTPAAPKTPPQIPDYLNPNPNPLQYPTEIEEVRVRGTQPISLEQAIELARRNNRELQVSLLELQRARAALREAQADLYPDLGLSAEIARQQSASSQLQSERTAEAEAGVPPELRTPSQDEPTSAFTGTAQLTYDLYTSGRRRANINAAEEQVRFQQLDVERLSEQIRLDVTTNYYDLQQADENVRIQQAAVTNAEASLRDAQALERAGVGTRFDVLRAQVNLANSQQNLTRALSQQRITSSQLATRLSIPGSINISAADPVNLAGLWNPTLEESIVLAFQNRPELQQFLAQRNISEQRRRLALSELGPQVSVIASYNLLDQFDDTISVTDGYSLGLRASLNLFDGGAARARAAQERANIRIAETQFAQQRDQTRFDVEQAYSNLQANLENVQTANAALDQAREALRLARLRFQAGVGTQTDVIAAETDLTTAEGNRVVAILDYNRALANLQRAVTTRALR
ncbi:MAG: TolC family protein [Chlorogloeopsis fritschii C42_A2020_084]|uniref:TolC family protein n=1 Tax=Chlorogloeopsis fritschii TaxID=1124 RepID=UPI0019DDC936|nr:TolC family protein [Chlorogloeopsis fritschii]MBF2008734.1 TolC family protein [Chlorogloeopsis fritschii C42_A2020_084]